MVDSSSKEVIRLEGGVTAFDVEEGQSDASKPLAGQEVSIAYRLWRHTD